MYFEIDEFLATLIGLTREQTSTVISLKQDELMGEVSQPRKSRGGSVVFRSFKFEISFLNKLGIEIVNGLIAPSSSAIDRIRIDNVVKNLSN